MYKDHNQQENQSGQILLQQQSSQPNLNTTRYNTINYGKTFTNIFNF